MLYLIYIAKWETKSLGKNIKEKTWLVTKADILEYIHSENLEKFPGKKVWFWLEI